MVEIKDIQVDNQTVQPQELFSFGDNENFKFGFKLGRVELTEKERQHKLFFEDGADFEFRFPGQECIKGNKTLLALHSNVFHTMLYGSMPQKFSEPCFDRDHYMMFLMCMLGFDDVTKENAFDIYPIAHFYEVDKVMNNIEKCLTPTFLDYQTCRTFCLAFKYNMTGLLNSCFTQLQTEPNIFHKINRKLLLACPLTILAHICQLFEEKAVKNSRTQLKSTAVFIALLEWTSNYQLRKGLRNEEVRTALKVKKLLHHFHLDAFSCARSFVSFYEANVLMRALFEKEEIMGLLIKLAKLPLCYHCFSTSPWNHEQSFSVDHDIKSLNVRTTAIPVWEFTVPADIYHPNQLCCD